MDFALEDFTESIRLDRYDDESYINRGLVRMDIGDIVGAIEDYTKAIRINPKNLNAFYNRGIAWEKKTDYQAALADYKKCFDLGDKDPTTRILIERMEKKLKQEKFKDS